MNQKGLFLGSYSVVEEKARLKVAYRVRSTPMMDFILLPFIACSFPLFSGPAVCLLWSLYALAQGLWGEDTLGQMA